MFNSQIQVVKTMTGTEGGPYVLAAETSKAAIGFRKLGNGDTRVRVELLNGSSVSLPGWKQPSKDQNRFSKVVYGESARKAAIAEAVAATL